MHQFGTNIFLDIRGLRLDAGRSWIGVCVLRVDTEELQTMSPSEIHHTRFKSKEVDIHERDNERVFPCRTGNILQEGQPSSTSVYKARGDLRQELQDTFSKE